MQLAKHYATTLACTTRMTHLLSWHYGQSFAPHCMWTWVLLLIARDLVAAASLPEAIHAAGHVALALALRALNLLVGSALLAILAGWSKTCRIKSSSFWSRCCSSLSRRIVPAQGAEDVPKPAMHLLLSAIVMLTFFPGLSCDGCGALVLSTSLGPKNVQPLLYLIFMGWGRVTGPH